MVTGRGGYFMNKEDTKGLCGLHTRIIAFIQMFSLIEYPCCASDATQVLLPINLLFRLLSFLEFESIFLSQLFSF